MYSSKYIKWGLFLLIFITIALLSIILSLSTGEVSISFKQVLSFLNNQTNNIDSVIINQIRLPRVLLGFSVGGALSISGVLLQGIYRNPLVEPYTLGISGGATLGIAMVIVLSVHQTLGVISLPIAGFLGSMATVFLVYLLSLKNGKINIQNMLLIGVMVSFISSSVMMLLMSTGSAETVHNIIFWIMGSLDETNKTLISISVITSVIGLLFTYFFVQPLNALRLGQEKARHLGINTDVTIKILFVIASILTGVSVSVAGIIGFVGLVIPHIIRSVVGNDYRIFLITSFLAGGSFIVLSDTLARVIIAPSELPVGVITGIIGGTVFIFMLTKQSLKRA